MTLYYVEYIDLHKANLITVDSKDRAKLWVDYPNAKEISKLEYDRILKSIKN
jgi:hypothetical protein